MSASSSGPVQPSREELHNLAEQYINAQRRAHACKQEREAAEREEKSAEEELRSLNMRLCTVLNHPTVIFPRGTGNKCLSVVPSNCAVNVREIL